MRHTMAWDLFFLLLLCIIHNNQIEVLIESTVQKSTCSKWSLMNVPDVHEHVAEEAPHLCTVAGMVDQGALHEVRLIGLQHPLV